MSCCLAEKLVIIRILKRVKVCVGSDTVLWVREKGDGCEDVKRILKLSTNLSYGCRASPSQAYHGQQWSEINTAKRAISTKSCTGSECHGVTTDPPSLTGLSLPL
ncbi:hypothetical protein RRG08_058583 [Elysia crispata]|uniref:Uncharacterized protein n=1 Tax=Elysia crispata TaxID=231223 RepID=A0AAE1AYT3_9GAST|nr:hypothetical protein RRG08_058583 [Elysia crispata]